MMMIIIIIPEAIQHGHSYDGRQIGSRYDPSNDTISGMSNDLGHDILNVK